MSARTATAGELLTAETRLIDLANQWITGLEAEGRIEQTTINEYRRVLDNLVLPNVGGLKLREATTGRLDRLLLRLRDQSVNRQRKAKVVLGAMLDLAVQNGRRETLARVHHEVRTPLAALLAHIELLDDEAGLEVPPSVELSMAAIRRSGARLRAVMAELDAAIGEPSPGLVGGRHA